MVKIGIAIDNIQNKSADSNTLNKVAELLRTKGHTVTTYGVGPNQIQRSMRSNSCDLMIQIAGGKCLGTLVDFYKGVGRYYQASKGGFMYFKCWDANWKAHRAWDDNFSKEKDLAPYKGKTLIEIYQLMKDKMFYGYGTTAEELVNTFMNSYQGTSASTSTSTEASSGGSNALELIKQTLTPLDPYGVDLLLNGDTVVVKRSNPNTATKLHENTVVNNSITFEEYDSNTPNTVTGSNGTIVKDTRLIDKYGTVSAKVDNTWTAQMMQVLKRDHGHSIDLKTIVNPYYQVGSWVKLVLPSLGIDDYYYVTKTSLEDITMSLTLEPAPPSIAVEQKGDTNNSSNGSVNKGRICGVIEKVGGIPITDAKSLYNNFKKMHYKLYYNDIYPLETELSRIQNDQTLNCADFAQVYYNAYKEAGFKDEIQIVRGIVQCTKQSYGHIWCRIKINGSWQNVDPSAAAAHNYEWGTLICKGGYTITNINPAWALSDDGKT